MAASLLITKECSLSKDCFHWFKKRRKTNARQKTNMNLLKKKKNSFCFDCFEMFVLWNPTHMKLVCDSKILSQPMYSVYHFSKDGLDYDNECPHSIKSQPIIFAHPKKKILFTANERVMRQKWKSIRHSKTAEIKTKANKINWK